MTITEFEIKEKINTYEKILAEEDRESDGARVSLVLTSTYSRRESDVSAGDEYIDPMFRVRVSGWQYESYYALDLADAVEFFNKASEK